MQSLKSEFFRKRLEFILRPFSVSLLFSITFCFCTSVLVVYFVGIEKSLCLVFLFICSLVIFLVFKQLSDKTFLVLTIAVVSILGGIARVWYFENRVASRQSILMFDKQDIKLRGKIIREIDHRGSSQRIVVDVEEAYLVEGLLVADKVEGLVLVQTYNAQPLVYGDKIFVSGKLEEPQDTSDFSYKTYLMAQGIFGTLNSSEIKKIEGSQSNQILVRLKGFKRYVTAKINLILPQPHASLLSGILFGSKSSMSIEFQDRLSRTGTTHIIAVSGFNITVLISCLTIFSPLIGRQKMSILSIVFVIFFMFFVGVDNIPVVRASLMGITLMLSRIFGRKGSIIVLFPLTVSILVFINPLVYLLLSFQLSFLSTLGLMLFSDGLSSRLSVIPEFVRGDVASTFSAILFTLPVTLQSFGEMSIISPLVNFFILPIVPLLTIGGLLFVIILLAITPVAKLLAGCFWLILEYMIKVITLFSKVPFAVISVNKQFVSVVCWLLIVLLLCGSVEVYYRRWKKDETLAKQNN